MMTRRRSLLQLIAASAVVSIAGAAPARIPPGLNHGYQLEVKPSVRVETSYRVSVSAPEVRAGEWLILIPRPPDLPSQRILGAATMPPGEVIAERSPLSRPVHRITIPVTDKKMLSETHAESRATAILYSRKLRQGLGTATKAVPDLSETERGHFLRRTVQFDHASPVLGKWIEARELVRRPREGEIDYARRVFRHLALNFEYEYLGEQNRAAPHVCEAGKSDCGGLSVLFATVLRSQGIPARTLAGRWAQSADPTEKLGQVDYRQEHIKAEFFAQGVGWVPVDPAGAILHDRSKEKLDHFGNDPGLFLTQHVDAELLVDTRRFGIRHIPLMQRAAYWMRGSGSLKNSVMQETWTVKRTPAGR